MKDIKKVLVKAGTNPAVLKMLNPMLWRVIPFNKPHRLKITELNAERVAVLIPLRKSNKNHLNGIHACALSTASEYASGLLILRHLGTKDYRLIMKSLHTEYHYQGKTAITAKFDLSEEHLKKTILTQIEKEGKSDLTCVIKAHDSDDNLISTTTCLWQIKSWASVKTKMS